MENEFDDDIEMPDEMPDEELLGDEAASDLSDMALPEEDPIEGDLDEEPVGRPSGGARARPASPPKAAKPAVAAKASPVKKKKAPKKAAKKSKPAARKAKPKKKAAKKKKKAGKKK